MLFKIINQHKWLHIKELKILKCIQNILELITIECRKMHQLILLIWWCLSIVKWPIIWLTLTLNRIKSMMNYWKLSLMMLIVRKISINMNKSWVKMKFRKVNCQNKFNKYQSKIKMKWDYKKLKKYLY